MLSQALVDSMIKIVEVNNKREAKRFINFPIKLYKGNDYFVPPLYMDEMKMFKPDYTYYDQADAICFNAYRDNEMVGRIQGIIQKVANTKYNQKRVRFTRFDSVDDDEVAKALFEAVETWAKTYGMDEIVGPLGFSDLEREGLLIEGFNEPQTFEEQYNYQYYQRLLENYGFEKEVDWTESQIRLNEKYVPKIQKLSDTLMKRYGFHFGIAKSTKDFLKKYADKFFEILDKTYVDVYGTVPFTDRMKKLLISNFNLIIDLRFVCVVLDKDEKVVAFGLCLPGIAEAVKKSNGHLTLPCIIRILKAVKKPKVVDFALIGVDQDFREKGAVVVILNEIMKMLKYPFVDHAETNLNLETNTAILSQWQYFDAKTNKRRRAFVKKI